jgi:membrane-associated protein
LEFLTQLFDQLRDLEGLVKWAGYIGLTLIIFAETGLLVGFFLPGDSLLVTAGLLAANPDFGLNVWLLGCILSVAAIVGDTVGYGVGKATGPRIFTHEDSLLFNKKHLLRAQAFYERRRSTRSTAGRRSSSPASCRSCAPSPRSWRVWGACTIARS